MKVGRNFKKTIMKHTTKIKAEWRVNTGGLLSEIAQCAVPHVAVLRAPIRIFGEILFEVGKRAAEINDPALNKLMARLAIYAETDPYSPDYNEKITHELLEYNP